MQLRADLCGKPFHILHTKEAVCLGAAMLAGICAGVYCDAQEAVGQVVAMQRTFLPDPVSRTNYEHQKRQYQLIYTSLQAVRDLEFVQD